MAYQIRAIDPSELPAVDGGRQMTDQELMDWGVVPYRDESGEIVEDDAGCWVCLVYAQSPHPAAECGQTLSCHWRAMDRLQELPADLRARCTCCIVLRRGERIVTQSPHVSDILEHEIQALHVNGER